MPVCIGRDGCGCFSAVLKQLKEVLQNSGSAACPEGLPNSPPAGSSEETLQSTNIGIGLLKTASRLAGARRASLTPSQAGMRCSVTATPHGIVPETASPTKVEELWCKRPSVGSWLQVVPESLNADPDPALIQDAAPATYVQPSEDDPQRHHALISKEAAEMRDALRNDARQYFISQSCPLEDQEEKWMTDEIMGIYVRAKTTPSERLDALVPALQWRMSRREWLSSLECPYCLENPLSHDCRCFGFDAEGDFVFMNCFVLPHNISADSVERHVACLTERMLAEFPCPEGEALEDDGHPRTRRWSFIFDLHGFGLRYWDPTVTLR